MEKKSVDSICDDIKTLAQYQYIKGFKDVLDIFNGKYLKTVWHKEDADKFFDDVMETLRDLNLHFYKITKGDQQWR